MPYDNVRLTYVSSSDSPGEKKDVATPVSTVNKMLLPNKDSVHTFRLTMERNSSATRRLEGTLSSFFLYMSVPFLGTGYE